MTNASRVQFLPCKDGTRLAWQGRRGESGKANLVWLGGFRADMGGTKAMFLDDWAAQTGRTLTRFDYFGHGQSDGRFEDGTIGRWADDALTVLDQVTHGPQILVGSSMGGWVAALLAKARPERLAAMMLIAPAPDFTEDLMWQSFPPSVRSAFETDGHWTQDTPDGALVVTRALIEDGRAQRVLDQPIAFEGPVRILHGMADSDVPWTQGLRLVDVLTSPDVETTLIKGGDHRLSTPANLDRLADMLDRLCRQVEAR